MDALKTIFEQQKALQDKIYEKNDIRDRDGNVLTIARVMQEAREGKFGPNHEPMRSLRDMVRAMRAELDEIDECLVYKHWSKAQLGEKVYPDQAPAERAVQVAVEIVDILHFVVNSCLALGIDSDDLLALYEEKRAINEERTNTNYNTAKKTNTDNDGLAARAARRIYPDSGSWK